MKRRMICALAALTVTTSIIGCKQPPPKPPEAIPPAMDSDHGPAVNQKLPTARRLDIKPQRAFEGVGAQWVAGNEPWYSVGPEQKLWRWDKFEPTEVAQRIYVRHQFRVTSDPAVLAVGVKQLRREGTAWTFDDAQARVLPQKMSRDGYEVYEGMLTQDLSTRALSVDWRPPRGRPRGNGKYDYNRPNKPSGPSRFVVILDNKTDKELYRRDSVGRSFAETEKYLGFLSGSTVVLVDRKTWVETEIPVPGLVGYLALNPHYFAVAGGGETAALFRISDSGEASEVGRWAIDSEEGVLLLDIHPTEPLVAVSRRKTAHIDIWAPVESVDEPAFTADDVSYGHFHAGGEHLIGFDRAKNATILFTLD